jgi:hypothetical protein
MKCLLPPAIDYLARKVGKVAVVALAALVLLGPVARIQAQQGSPLVKLKENNKLEANGNARLVYEMKLPQGLYTQLKKNTPNMALFIRKLGLNNQNLLIEDVKGEWLDGDSTLRIEFTALGIARAVKGNTWEVPLFDGVDTELLAVADGTAILTQASNMPGVGLATSSIRIKMPEGATDVKVQKMPSRLSYQLPTPTNESGQAAAEFEVENKPQIMSSLAKAMSNRQLAALWTARTKFKNTGAQTLKDYRVRFPEGLPRPLPYRGVRPDLEPLAWLSGCRPRPDGHRLLFPGLRHGEDRQADRPDARGHGNPGPVQASRRPARRRERHARDDAAKPQSSLLFQPEARRVRGLERLDQSDANRARFFRDP